MVTSPTNHSALEPKDGTPIKEQGKGKADAIHSEASTFKGTHTMGTNVVRIKTHQPTAPLMDDNESPDLPTGDKGNKQYHDNRAEGTNISPTSH